VCRSAREKPYLRAAPSEYRVDTANGQDNDDAQTRTGELWASYGLHGQSLLEASLLGPLSGMPTIRPEPDATPFPRLTIAREIRDVTPDVPRTNVNPERRLVREKIDFRRG